MRLEAPDLARWTRFAAKGGIGKCTATCDCVAESADDLMFLKDDEITVLLQHPDQENLFLGYCEGVVGHFSGSDVHFHAKLKVPIKAKRASTSSRKSPTPSSGVNSPIGQPSSPLSTSSKITVSGSHQHAALIPTVHKHNIHMPPPLNLTAESTSPLRITKRTPASPPAPQLSLNPSQLVSPSPPPSSVPDTSLSTLDERFIRDSVGMSDGEVGIGLSLLQDLANGMDSDSDDSDDDKWSKPNQHNPAAGTPDPDSYAAALSRVGHRRDSLDEETQESTIEGLGYARSEDEEKGERELAGTGRRAVIVEDMPSQTMSVVTTKRASPNFSIYPNSNANGSHNPKSLPSSTSPISPSFSHSSSSTNERRPSLVPSATSASEWEGASDIYDDYRYSRYSIASKMSRFSSSAGIGGWAGSVPLTPPLPDSSSMGRARTDSNRSRPNSSSASARSRTDSVNTGLSIDSSSTSSEMKVAGAGSLLSSLPLLPEASEIGGGQEPQVSQQQSQLRNLHPKRTTIMKERTMSIESAASVYTQNSRLSALSQDAIAPISSGSNGNNHFPTSFTPSDTNSNNPNATSARPTALSLSRSEVKSPLLHTTWGTPLSSSVAANDGRSSAGSGSLDLHTVGITAVGGGARAGDAIPFEFTEEGRMKGSSDMTTGSLGHGGNGVGIATALRQRLETEGRSPMPEQTQNQRLIRDSSDRKSDGLGHRIVVEDEDELPSRILDTSGSTFMSLTTTASPEPIHDEDEEDSGQDHRSGNTGAGDRGSFLTSSAPDPDMRTRLSPLTVMNRTPSPSVLEGASVEVRGSGTAIEVEEKEEQEQGREQEGGMGKEIIPTAFPLNASTSPPQSSFSSSPPHVVVPPPRLSSASGITIRMGSPPIELRPPLALSDIREPGGPPVPGSNKRQSLFLPHPNAPKSPNDGIGGVTVTGLAGPGPGVPMYIAAQQQEGQQGGWARVPGGPPHTMMPPVRPNVIGVIRMALTAPPRVAMVKSQGSLGQGAQGPTGQRSPLMAPIRGPTIYGRTETDLAVSMGPVPIMFSIDPPLTTARPSFSNPIPAPQTQGTPTSKPTMPSSPPRAPVQMMTKRQPQSEPQHPPRSASLLGSTVGAPAVGASVSNVGASAVDGDATPAIEPKTMGDVIPRANFFPKPPGMRPRSRSFSGFNSTIAEVPLPLQRSRDRAEIPSRKDVKRSLTTSVSSPSPSTILSPSPPSGLSKLASRLSPLRPSPLSFSQNSVTGGILRHSSGVQPALRSPTSPLSQSVVIPPVASSLPASPNNLSMGMSNRPQHQLRETASRATLNEALSPPSPPIPILPTIPQSATGSIDSSLPSPPPSQSHGGTTSIQAQSRNDAPSRASDADAVSINSDTRSQPIAQQPSLRTKLSLPNLGRHRSRQEDESGGGDSEKLQVRDMEFELVKPNFALFQSARASDDLGKDYSPIDVCQDGNAFLRAESPAISMSSAASKRSPSMSEHPPPTPITVPRATTDSESSMDAHRNRENKWMSLMSSSPASQARKSKKVRKLLMDGVPSSVRYLVWSYLTDGKARCVPGVYTQLCSRGRVPSSADIERDIKNCFLDQPHLQGTQGPVLLLLQAYLNMVPDIQYTMGLTLIVGQLLLLAPEEDAFWIFISIMDTHIRPYFSTVTTQMEVDSALFSRALESNDNQVAKKLLVDMGISPPAICQPWFSSLFVGTLPPEYLNRIWDLFLFEGIPFLLRVALAIVACCRRAILESTSEETVLHMFRHLQQSLLPPSPEAFLSLVCSLKFKDDDVRKQRVKMEAQIKRQTQAPRAVPIAGGISLPRT